MIDVYFSNLLIQTNRGPQFLCLFQMCLHTFFHMQKAGLRFKRYFKTVWDTKAGEPLNRIYCRNAFDSNPIEFLCQTHASNHCTVRRSGHHQTTTVKQCSARKLFQIVPQFISTLQQWDIIGMLKIGLADDAGFTMRTAPIMGDTKLFYSQDIQSAFRKMIKGTAAHSPQPQYQIINMTCHECAAICLRNLFLRKR